MNVNCIHVRVTWVLSILTLSIVVTAVTCTFGDIRLVDGSSDDEGRVELFVNNTWGTVHDDSWDMGFNSTIWVNFDCYLQETPKWLNIPFPCSAILHLYRSGQALFVLFYINLPTGVHKLNSSLPLILHSEPKINYLLSSASKQSHSLANLHLRVIEWTTQG